jgi:hypothetical protein
MSEVAERGWLVAESPKWDGVVMNGKIKRLN